MSLPTLPNTVQTLQKALQAKAKAEPSYRFYSLWDKVYRGDVLREAYRHCHANGGAPGVDRVSFEQIEAEGVETWLGKLQEELRTGTYGPLPPPSSVDPQEQWRPTTARHTQHSGPGGPDGYTAGDRTDL